MKKKTSYLEDLEVLYRSAINCKQKKKLRMKSISEIPFLSAKQKPFILDLISKNQIFLTYQTVFNRKISKSLPLHYKIFNRTTCQITINSIGFLFMCFFNVFLSFSLPRLLLFSFSGLNSAYPVNMLMSFLIFDVRVETKSSDSCVIRFI